MANKQKPLTLQQKKKAVFKNGTRTLTMKIQTENKDGSVILIDGSRLEKEEIIKIEKS